MRSRGGLSADFVDFVCTWGEHAGEVVEAGGEVVQLWGEFVHVYGGWHGLGGIGEMVLVGGQVCG